MKNNFFVKSHGLGNDYIVIDQEYVDFELTVSAIKRICDYHFGIGSDGILVKVPSKKADFGLKICNPDGSEAEKSGNGLRIFCKFLYDYGFTLSMSFTVETKGGLVFANIIETADDKARIIQVDMGKAIFEPARIPVNLGDKECIDEVLKAEDHEFRISCVSVGNPHCVIIREELREDEILKYGPIIEHHKVFPNRINVQFAKPVSQNEVQILVWERGAGFTLASGSSSCAVASVMKKKRLTGNDVTINMKGGNLKIHVDDQWNIRMTGEVREIANGILSPELLNDIPEIQ